MSMHQSELPDAKTPSRKGFTVGRIQAGAAWRLTAPLATCSPISILCDYAHAPPAPTRSHAAPPRPHAATRPDVAQGRAAAPASRQAARCQAARGAQAPRLAPPCATPDTAPDTGVGHDRGRVHQRRPAVSALSRPDGGPRPRRGDDRRHRVWRAGQPVDIWDSADECRDGGASRGARVRAQSGGRVRVGNGDRRDWSVGRGTAEPRTGAEGRGLREYTVLARGCVRAVPPDRAPRDAARRVERAAVCPG